jgi:DHA1 family bicyclomycin/chloramphenicol resistance-like MFS transporter
MNLPSPAALTTLLAVMGLLNAFCSDLFIPALPAMKDELGVTPWQAQQMVSLFFIACAFMSLWHGALADAYGRRRTILACLAVLGVSALGCVFAERIGQLWGLRLAQGLASGAGMVVSRAIVRDLHGGLAAQRMLSHILMVQTLALAIIPVIGTGLTLAFGWRSIFVAITAIALLLGLAYWRWLPETLAPERRQSLHPVLLWRAYREVLSCPTFMRLSVAHVANWVCMVIYLVAAPAFVIRLLGRGATEVYLVYVPVACGLLAGFLLFPQIARRWHVSGALAAAYGVLAFAVALNLALCGLVPAGLIHILPLFVYAVGLALALPILVGRALEPLAERSGVASSCQTFLQFAMMAVAAGLLVPLLWDSLLKLALGTGLLTALGGAAVALERRAGSRALRASQTQTRTIPQSAE